MQILSAVFMGSPNYMVELEHIKPAIVTCTGTVGMIGKLVNCLSTNQLQMFRSTCFGHLVDLDKLQLYNNVIHSILMRRIVTEVEDDLCFAPSPGYVISFSLKDFCLITGLKGHNQQRGSNMRVSESVGFLRRQFPGAQMVTVDVLYNKLRSGRIRSDDDVIRIAMLCFVYRILLGCSGGELVATEHLLLADSILDLNAYEWGLVSFEATVASIRRVFEQHNTVLLHGHHEHEQVSYKLGGFALALQIWFIEAIPILGLKCAEIVSRDATPRILKWQCVKRPRFELIEEVWKKEVV